MNQAAFFFLFHFSSRLIVPYNVIVHILNKEKKWIIILLVNHLILTRVYSIFWSKEKNLL
ncbi:MAG: hypothetical protein EXX96DRAFT_563288 [Benjaminiella poitrasii]|nr:MAG: hypothetical protein EXX96DRAFT_563288 [Benjaminiella poitrasii]